jgi:hypothetical protein
MKQDPRTEMKQIQNGERQGVQTVLVASVLSVLLSFLIAATA